MCRSRVYYVNNKPFRRELYCQIPKGIDFEQNCYYQLTGEHEKEFFTPEQFQGKFSEHGNYMFFFRIIPLDGSDVEDKFIKPVQPSKSWSTVREGDIIKVSNPDGLRLLLSVNGDSTISRETSFELELKTRISIADFESNDVLYEK